MKGLCGVDINEDKIFISFATGKKSNIKFIGETNVKTPKCFISRELGGIIEHLKSNSEILNSQIKKQSKKHCLKIKKVYLNLPARFVNRKSVEEIVPLRRRKKITPRDLFFAKKYIENKFLEWDDHCLHHLVCEYRLEGEAFKPPPIGMMGKKIGLVSSLFWIKEKFYKEIQEIFFNLDMDFGGIVAEQMSVVSSGVNISQDISKQLIMIKVGYASSSLAVLINERFEYASGFNLSLKGIIEGIAERFMLPLNLAEEVLNRYISFKRVSSGLERQANKEVSIRNENYYINLSIYALNNFVREYIKTGIINILENTKGCDHRVSFSVIGRLNSTEGIHEFLKDFVPYRIKYPFCFEESSSFGCLKYGIYRFMEDIRYIREPVLQKVRNIYREYF